MRVDLGVCQGCSAAWRLELPLRMALPRLASLALLGTMFYGVSYVHSGEASKKNLLTFIWFLHSTWSLCSRNSSESSITPRTSAVHTRIYTLAIAAAPAGPGEMHCGVSNCTRSEQVTSDACLIDGRSRSTSEEFGACLTDTALDTGTILGWRMTTFDKNTRTQGPRSTNTRKGSGIEPTSFEEHTLGVS